MLLFEYFDLLIYYELDLPEIVAELFGSFILRLRQEVIRNGRRDTNHDVHQRYGYQL